MPTTLKPYQERLQRWLPGARFAAARGIRGADGILRWQRGGRTVTYRLEHTHNLAQQDVRVAADRLQRIQVQDRGAPTRVLLLAPFIRREQGVVLQDRGIDYADLAGNAHLEAPGLFVHVEGLRPAERTQATRARMTRGWVKTVMALLVQPDLVRGPYRPIANAADVALGTVTACFTDLKARGFLHGDGPKRRFTNVPELIALWVQAYVEVLRPRLTELRFQIKGTDKHERWQRLAQALRAHQVRWALAGVDAATLDVPHLRTDETEIYAPPDRFERRELLRALEAQPAVRGNLGVIEPPAAIALQQTGPQHDMPAAPVLLTYAELRYRGDDQANEAADLLLPLVLERAQP